MLVYVIIIIWMLIAYDKSHSIHNFDIKYAYEVKCLKIYVVILSLLAALKYVAPGSDASGYWWDYISADKSTFEDIFIYRSDYIVYFMLNKLLSMTGLPAHFWFAFIEAVYFGSFMMFVNRYSRDKIFSMILSFTIGVLEFTFLGSKQTLAMGFALFSFIFFMDKKYIYSIIFMFFAYNSHHSTLIILICFLLWKFANSKSYWTILISSALMVFVFGRLLITTALNVIDSEHYSTMYMNDQTKYSTTTFWFYLLLIAVGLMHCKAYLNKDGKYSKFFLGNAILCMVVQSMAQLSADFFRLAYIFIPFVAVCIPNCFEASMPDSKSMKTFLLCFVIFFFLYTNRGGGYIFMWER